MRLRGFVPRRIAAAPFWLLTAAAFLAAAGPAHSQVDGAPITLGTYRVLHSAILSEDRTLQVHLPEGYGAGAATYPVLYVFYSDRVDGYFAQLVNDLSLLTADRMPETILVGVPNTQRYRDLLPWPRPGGQPGDGHADRFLRFVREELIPFVDREYRTKPYRIMVGPQAAAVFGIYSLLEAPGTFQAFILNDPCQIDNMQRSLCRELQALAGTPATRGLYFAVSHDEGERRWDRRPLDALRAALRANTAAGFRWSIELERDWPFFLAPVRARAALLDLFRDYPFPSPERAASLAEIRSHYDSLSATFGFSVDPPDLVLTLAGSSMVGRGMYPAALEVLNHLAALYPSSLNGPWQLANLHRLMGDTTTALRYYEECVRRNPDMTPARDWITRLRGGRN